MRVVVQPRTATPQLACIELVIEVEVPKDEAAAERCLEPVGVRGGTVHEDEQQCAPT